MITREVTIRNTAVPHTPRTIVYRAGGKVSVSDPYSSEGTQSVSGR